MNRYRITTLIILCFVFSRPVRLSSENTAELQRRINEFFRTGVESYRHGEYEKADEFLKKAWKLDKKNMEIKELSGRVDAVTKYIKEQKAFTQEHDLIRKGICAYIEGDNKQALMILRYAFSVHPENEALRKMIRILEKNADTKILEQLTIPEDMNYVEYLIFQAKDEFIKGEYDKSLVLTQNVLSLEPIDINAHAILGASWWAIGNFNKAKEHWKKAVIFSGYKAGGGQPYDNYILMNETEKLYSEAVKSYRKGEFRESRKVFEELEKKDKRDTEYKEYIEKLEIFIKRFVAAEEIAKKDELARKGIAYFIENKMEQSVACLNYAFTVSPENEELRQILKYVDYMAGEKANVSVPPGMTYVEMKLYNANKEFLRERFDLAMGYARDVIILEPNNQWALALMGLNYWAMNRIDKAVEYWDKVGKVDVLKPGPDGFYLRGIPLEKEEKPADPGCYFLPGIPVENGSSPVQDE